MTATHHFAAMTRSVVDENDGIIRNASLITKGEAQGHFDSKGRQVMVDEVTLQQIYDECRKLGKIKVKADHGSGVMATVGWADNFSLTAEKVTADIHLYDSEPSRPRLLEIAGKNPSHIGISMEFDGKDKPSKDLSLSRCSQVFAAAIVSDPAANTSLFSAVTEPEPDNNMDDIQDTKQEPTLADLASMIGDLTARIAALETPAAEPDGDELEVPAANPEDEPPTVDKDDEKTYSEDEVKKVAELAAERAVKLMGAKIGVQLSRPGAPTTEPAKVKTYSEMVDDEAKNFDGDRIKAEAHLLSKLGTNPAIKKAYEAQRNVKIA